MIKQSIYFLLYFFLCISCSSSVQLSSITESPFSGSSQGRRDRESLRQNLNNTSTPCKENNSCVLICDDMYLKADELNRCYNTYENIVEDILDVFEELENPKRISDLNDIDLDDFKAYLKIGIQSFIDLIDPIDKDEDGDRINDDWEDIYAYDADNVEVVIEWICSDHDVHNVINARDLPEIANELIAVVYALHSSSKEDGDKECNRIIGEFDCDAAVFLCGGSS